MMSLVHAGVRRVLVQDSLSGEAVLIIGGEHTIQFYQTRRFDGQVGCGPGNIQTQPTF